MRASLNKQSVNLSEKVVQRLMKQEHLVVAVPKRRRYGSYQGEISPAPDNLINRDFQAAAPNRKWLTDSTEFHIPAGKVYLSPMIDCFDGMVVSWSIGTRPDAELVNSMLDAAVETVASSSERPVLHSDSGAHYRWPGRLSRIASARLTRSMSRKACCPDNAACEGFFGRLKTEPFYTRNWRYNEKRIKSSLTTNGRSGNGGKSKPADSSSAAFRTSPLRRTAIEVQKRSELVPFGWRPLASCAFASSAAPRLV